MRTLNKVLLLGSVGKDPEVRSTPSGATIATFTIATNHRFKGSDGNWQEKTEWHSLKAFGRTAELVRDYVKKGDPLHIEGRLETESWDDKASGQKRYRTVIIVDNLILLGSKGKASPKIESPFPESPSPEIDDSDVPF